MGVSENYQPVKFTVASSWIFYFALLHPNYFELKERKKIDRELLCQSQHPE